MDSTGALNRGLGERGISGTDKCFIREAITYGTEP
ncbi:hypothetical protein IMSAGC019_03135 [Lachnospiraceae bacterium]|nr:hypothetical protein IMSAGC019_03135 [Lachnospiraceae bacterium]